MHRSFVLITLLVLAVAAAMPAGASKAAPYQTGFDAWLAAQNGFAGWTTSSAAVVSDGSLRLSGGSAASEPVAPGGYYGGNFYNGGSFVVGEATSPPVTTDFGFTEAIASWNADTPAGTWIETQISASIGGRWTKWYNLGIWAATDGSLRRHSVRLQGDGDGFVAVDTLILNGKKAPPADSYRLKVRLFSENGSVPSLRNLSLAYSTAAPTKPELGPGNPALWNRLLAVPECSQEVYPDGGEVWCSPTSISMVLAYWAERLGEPVLDRSVPEVAAGTYDPTYDGHGNWPFNTAYAGRESLTAYVSRFSSLNQVERWIEVGAPVVASLAWGFGTLADASVPSTDGHLLVIIGFSDRGDVEVNDPAGDPRRGQAVRRVYRRDQFESLWLQSGGTVYLIHPNAQAPSADGAFGAW